ncbi:hypothetical protein VTN77DRAFT_8652 [Rasamsonia byssochlamydoides]|uniref:uncharacterized protein n=1 Tax=Rasamsonia byssochlamydoides TaxID=89139 RepID=UPI003741F808
MKVKQRSTCHTCRARKLGCDGKRPECTQCVFTGRKCQGYELEWTFIQHNVLSAKLPNPVAADDNKRKESLRKTPSTLTLDDSYAESPSRSLMSPFSGFSHPTWDDLIGLVVKSYLPEDEMPLITDSPGNSRSQICGSWVEVLPTLTGRANHDCVLPSATKALAVSIISRSPEQNIPSLDSTQTYYAAIRALRKAFTTTDRPSHAELAAAIMCLSLAELMSPNAAAGLSAHIKGVGELIRAHGPEQYRSGILHKLFIGFRPLLVIEAFRARQPTFLALEEWICVPFSLFAPSPMQNLLSQVAIVPSMLHQIDRFTKALCEPTPSDVTETFFSLVDVVIRLENWEISLQSETDGPCYWPRVTDRTPTKQSSSSHDPSIWFPNITMANVFTHLWAFRIVCLAELEKLASSHPYLVLEAWSLPRHLRLDRIQDHILALSKQICHSMEYLMQDEMKLFGPASTLFPLKTAYERFKLDGPRQQEHVAWCESIIRQLVAKGFHAAPIIVFGN